MTDFWTVANAFWTMVIMIVMGVGAVVGFGYYAHDMVIPMFQKMGFDAASGVDGWDSTGLFWFADKLFITLLFMPAPLGVIIFIIACTRRQRRDEYADTQSQFTNMNE